MSLLCIIDGTLFFIGVHFIGISINLLFYGFVLGFMTNGAITVSGYEYN